MRQPKPFYKTSRQTWYVTLKGKQISLGKDEAKAWEKYHQLMASSQEPTEASTVLDILNKFLAWSKANNGASTHTFYHAPCVSFGEYIGKRLLVTELKKRHLQEWIDTKYKSRSGNYKRNLLRGPQRAFNWAVEQEYLASSPLDKLKKPPYTPRDAIMTEGQWAEMMAAIESRGPRGRAFLELVWFMRHTGCRPLEARIVEAKQFNAKESCFEFERREKGKLSQRVIKLTPDAVAHCERMAVKYPTGPLLRNDQGRPWKCAALTAWFRRLRSERPPAGKKSTQKKVIIRKAGYKYVDFEVTPYAVRHTFATDAIVQGMDVAVVAKLMGHKDTKMLMEVYAHLEKKGEFLSESLQKSLPKSISSSDVLANPEE